MGKPSPMFFLLAVSKLLVISGVFYLVSRAGDSAVLFHILGLSVIVLAIFVEAGYQLYRSFSNGRA
jgi:chromate transport protein ChrA